MAVPAPPFTIDTGKTVVPNLRGLPKFPSRKSLVAGSSRLISPAVGANLQIRVIGLTVAIEHWAAFQALVPGYMWVAQFRAGELMSAEAKLGLLGERGFPKAVLSGDTLRSVYHSVSTTPTTTTVSVGPTTFYAPLIEFGLARHSKFGPRPFMAMALTATLPWLIQAYVDLAGVAKHGARAVITSPPYKKDLEAYLRRWRRKLYKIERALGNVAVLAPLGFTVPGTGKFRSAILGMAREIGDIQAIMKRTVGLRFQRRLVGKVTGRLIGVGSRTIFVNQSVGARISGAERLYNVKAGNLVTKYIDQSNSFLGR